MPYLFVVVMVLGTTRILVTNRVDGRVSIGRGADVSCSDSSSSTSSFSLDLLISKLLQLLGFDSESSWPSIDSASGSIISRSCF